MAPEKPFVAALVPAAGLSSRMGGLDKLGIPLEGKPLLLHTLMALGQNPLIDLVVVAARPGREAGVEQLCREGGLSVPIRVVAGGATRLQSVKRAADAAPEADFFCVHDAARPFVSQALITRVIEAAFEYGAAVPALPLVDTVKFAEGGFAVSTPDRSSLVSVATPQVARADWWREATAGTAEAWDDAQPLELMGRPVRLVEGERQNIKITNPGDLNKEDDMRIGEGYDAHRLVAGRRLVLCGVEIPFEKGLLGHSDADVAAHALADALFGAAALGDIGLAFPDSDAAYEGADSIDLLSRAVEMVADVGYRPSNADLTIICQAPKLRPYIDAMRRNLAGALGLDLSRVSVKATTEEGMGFTGLGDGIAARAVVLLRRTF